MDTTTVFKPEIVGKLTYDTPFFLFSAQEIAQTVQYYKNALPQAQIFYALKANSEPEVLKTIYENGCGFEAASVYELEFLKKIGVRADNIIYGTSVKPLSHIRAFDNYGVDRFAFDSPQELDKISSINPKARVYVRVLVDDSGSVFTMSEKFGVSSAEAMSLMLLAKSKGLIPYGLSFNVGSQALNPEAWSNAISTLVPVIEELEKEGVRLHMLNLGGGYPNSYLNSESAPSFQEIAANIKKSLARLPYQMAVVIEPGRGLVARSMALVVSVIAKIKRPNGHWLYLDAGAYNALLETMAYQGSLKYKFIILKNYPKDTPTEKFILTGPTGDSLDVVDKEAVLPGNISVNDRLMIYDTGAYSTVLTTPFNGFPKLPVYSYD